ncbi:MAG: anti-sigma B factor antagonist [Bacteroidia bacterium]|jgi:anti-sigma B factor antagonist
MEAVTRLGVQVVVNTRRIEMSLEFNHTTQGLAEVITVSGRLMSKIDSEALISAVNDLLADERLTLVMELSDLEYMNSSGLNILLGLFTATRNAGGDMHLCNVSKKVEDLLVMTKLNSVFKIYKSMDEAVSAFSE